jgi:FAD/FMN-containing dehydrogenase
MRVLLFVDHDRAPPPGETAPIVREGPSLFKNVFTPRRPIIALARGTMSQPISRRRFLMRSAQLVVGAGAVVGLRPRAGARGLVESASPRAWQELAARLTGPLLRPGDPGYAAIAQPNNLRFAANLPGGIARCESAQDVAQSLGWCREFAVPLAARCGGHNYAGYSTTPGLLIDLSPLDTIAFDAGTGVATVGGGVRNTALYTTLQELGVTITHGRCPTVGVGGYYLGGGIGFNMRAHGLACDQLVATEIVTADGQVRSVAGLSDLFWACRGGAGGNFGVNTSFSVQTFPVPPVLTVFSISWSARPEAVYTALLAALDAAPPGLGSRLQITAVTAQERAAGTDASVQLLGQFTGTVTQVRQILAPAYAVAAPDSEAIQTRPYWDAQINFLSEPGGPALYQERSRFFTRPLDAGAIATAFDWARRLPADVDGAHMVLFQTGQHVNDPAPDATAFVHRDSLWLMTIALYWNESTPADVVQRDREWQDAFYDAIVPFTGGGAYQNFPDPSLADWLDAYYGANLPRLTHIKAAVDPTRLFRYPQSIPPA